MKTAIASDPGDDGAMLLLRAAYMGTKVAYLAPGAMAALAANGTSATWIDTGAGAASARWFAGQRLPSDEALRAVFQTSERTASSDRDSGADLISDMDDHRIAAEFEEFNHSRPSAEIDTSGRFRQRVSRHYWSAKLGPLTVTMRFLYQRGWLQLPSLSPGWLTGAAVVLAGRKRSAVGDEWRSHLYGWPDRELSRRNQVRAARGFLWSAVRYRLQDAADLAWRPIDAVLGSRFLSNLFVWGPVIAMLVAILHHDGRFGLVADVQDPLALGAFLYCVIKTGRWWRGVKPPEPKAQRAREK